MYVVELTNSTGSAVGTVPINAVVHFPADRCQWQQAFVKPVGTAGHYDISSVHFFNGADAGGVDYSALQARMGYVAKTGRFVPMTI